MVRFLKLLLVAPIAIVFLIFAFANRHEVTISFDPFEGDIARLAVHAPMFVIVILCVAIGVIAGGVATWFSQGRHRRDLRALRAETEKLRLDLQAARGAAPSIAGLARRA